MKTQIKSIKQIADELKTSKQELECLLNYMSFDKLSYDEDLERKKPTVDDIITSIPKQERLKMMMDHPYYNIPEYRGKSLENYHGDYDLVTIASRNSNIIKPESQRVYFLVSQLKVPKIEMYIQESEIPKLKLKSYDVTKDENHIKQIQKNMIIPQYLIDLRKQQKQNVIVKDAKNHTDFIKIGEPLITVSFYDSVSGVKNFQYMLYSQQTLLDLAKAFYCLIAKLEGKLQQHFNNSFFLIQENFYYYGAQIRKKLDDIIGFSHDSRDYLKFDMSKIQIKYLRIIFGRTYLFRHLEGCDHYIIFKDLTILDEKELVPLKKQNYPLVTFQGRMKKRKCEGCKIEFATLVSLNDPLKQGRNLYLCENCKTNLYLNQQEGYIFVKYEHD